jgi:hypothetical protein
MKCTKISVALLGVLAAACSSSHGGPDAGDDAFLATCGSSVCGEDEACCTGCTPEDGFCIGVDLPCPSVACITSCEDAVFASVGDRCEGSFSCVVEDEACCPTSTFCDDGRLARDIGGCLDVCDPPPVMCDGLGPAACAAAGCVPTYDDACCPTCSAVGFCADCTDPTYFICRPYEDACMAAYCSRTAEWGCTDETPDCSSATPYDSDSCDVYGCVPAIGPVGSPELPPVCVPITGSSCTVGCRGLPPECPSDTIAEGDGSCWMGLCIPGFVCE